MARNFILDGTIEYHLQQLKEALGEGLGSGEYTFDEVMAELQTIDLFHALENYLYELKEEIDEGDA